MSEKANRLNAPQHFTLCKWLDTMRGEIDRDGLTKSQLARRAAAKLGYPVTSRNVSYAARAIGMELATGRGRRGGPRQRLRSQEVIAAALIVTDVRVRLLAKAVDDLLASLGQPRVTADQLSPLDPNIRRIARGVAMVPPAAPPMEDVT